MINNQDYAKMSKNIEGARNMSDKIKKLDRLKDAISNNKDIKDEHKEQALSKVKEWYIEDKAEGILGEELLKITKEFAPILEEIGLL